MSAKDKAFNKSLILTEQRIEAIARQKELDQTESLPVTYQGHDAATGTAKFSRGGDCCDCNIISGGETITTGAIAVGETVMSRPTEGNIRLDRKPSTSNPTECGSGGSPNPRGFGLGGNRGNDEGKRVPEAGYSCPINGTIREGSRRIVGLAEEYEIYTGNQKSGVAIGGAPKELWEICETELVRIPNSSNARNPSNPYAGVNDDGCVKPTDAPAGTLKRCQWYDATEEQALNLTGAPDGMFVSGSIEYPEGYFRILACMEEEEPATEEGTGFDWNPANVLSSGSASPSVNYCSGIHKGELIWNLGSHETSNPPISYQLGTQALLIDDEVTQYPKEISGWTLTPVEGEGIEVDWGGGDVDFISGTSWTQTSGVDWAEIARITFPSNIFCAGSLTRGDTGASEVQDRRWRGDFYNPNTGLFIASSSISNANTRWRVRHAVPQRFLVPPCGAAPGDGWNTVVEWEAATGDIGASGTSLGSRAIINSNPLPIAVAIMSEYSVWIKITSDTGAFSLRETTTPPNVSLSSNGCELVVSYSDGTASSPEIYPVCPQVSALQNAVLVSDSNGLAATYEHSSIPTNFRYACRSNTPNC